MGNYVSIAEANAVLDYDPDVGTEWTALGDPAKEGLISFAEYWIDHIPGYHWLGEKVGDSQVPEFPRDGIVAQAEDFASYDMMPDQIKDALAAAELTDVTIPAEIKTAVIETIRKSTQFNENQSWKLQKFIEMGTSKLKVDVLDFTWDLDKRWGRPMPRMAWDACRFLMVGYWTQSDAKWIQRL